jgi:polar amino acid transport system substrate-binding protein
MNGMPGRAIAACLLFAWATTASATDLRIGISSDNPPWSFVAERVPAILEGGTGLPPVTPAQFKQLSGLDVDVARALAQRMGMSPKFVSANWLSIEKELLEDRFDVILSSWTPSRKTPPTVTASEPYYNWGLVIAVHGPAAKVASYRDLASARLVGYYNDPAVEQTLRSLGTAHTKAFDSEGVLFKALVDGTLDALVHDSTYVRWRVNTDPTIRIVGEPLNRLGYHVGVRTADKELLAKVNTAVRDLAASPEMAEIRKKAEAFGK